MFKKLDNLFFRIEWVVAAVMALAAGCAIESHKTILPEKTAASGAFYSGPKIKLAVGKFANRSGYMRGLFSDGNDRLGSQAKTVLITHLQQTGRFNLLDRGNMEEIAREALLQGKKQQLKGAEFVVTGQVTEFGRKEVGDMQLFGILGAGKQQAAYAKVALHVVDVLTSDVILAVQGAGEYILSTREIVGFGSFSGYDSTLNGKVLDLAIREAVNRLIAGIGAVRHPEKD